MEAMRPAAVADTGRAPRPRANPADVRFMRDMIAHHAQALEMAELVPGRAGRAELRLLAERIAVSQRDEIAAMERWLRSRGEEVPAGGAHHHHGAAGGDHAGMAGMATPEEMARLAASRGAEFDRLFLELMIRHHEGALTMVAALFASSGGGQEAEIFQLASDVEADQRAEIARMRRLQNGPAPAAPQR
jgi:uncharacterized protein (DUF305 family)